MDHQKLMAEWASLEPSRCGGAFVRVFDDASPNAMECVDEYGDGNLHARWDEAKIEMAVRTAIEARGWQWSLRTCIIPDNYNAAVRDGQGEQILGCSESVSYTISAFALLSAYLNALRADTRQSKQS